MRNIRIINFLFLSIKAVIRPFVLDIILNDIRVFGDKKRLKLSKKSYMTNTLFNTYSGNIVVGDYSFTGHNVSIITGSHNYNVKNVGRLKDVPDEGNDINIGEGVWIGSNSTIIGPCTIGDNAVIGASSLVLHDVAANTIVAGIPAKLIKTI